MPLGYEYFVAEKKRSLWLPCCLSVLRNTHGEKTPKTTGQSWDGWRKCLGGGRWLLVRQKGLREEIAKARIKKEGRDKRWWRSLRHCWFGLAVQYVSLIIVFYKKNARNILESGVSFSWFFLCNVRHVVHDVFFFYSAFFHQSVFLLISPSSVFVQLCSKIRI